MQFFAPNSCKILCSLCVLVSLLDLSEKFWILGTLTTSLGFLQCHKWLWQLLICADKNARLTRLAIEILLDVLKSDASPISTVEWSCNDDIGGLVPDVRYTSFLLSLMNCDISCADVISDSDLDELFESIKRSELELMTHTHIRAGVACSSVRYSLPRFSLLFIVPLDKRSIYRSHWWRPLQSGGNVWQRRIKFWLVKV